MASPGFGARGGGCAPSPEKFLNFYIKMVSSGAFGVAISYRLAACFTGIGSTCGVEIYLFAPNLLAIVPAFLEL